MVVLIDDGKMEVAKIIGSMQPFIADYVIYVLFRCFSFTKDFKSSQIHTPSNAWSELTVVSMRSLTLDGCWLVKERCSPLTATQFSTLRRYPRNSSAKHQLQPSPAQLLRFALTGTTCSGNGDNLDTRLDERLTLQFQKNWLPRRSKAIDTASQSLPNNLALPKFTKGDGLSRLRADIETFVNSEKAGIKLLSQIQPLQNAFSQCQTKVEREDLIATVNGLLARLRRLGVKDTHQLLILGMSYAAENFSSDSLAHYVRQYSREGYGLLPQPVGVALVKSLSNGLERRSWEDPTTDKSKMLSVVAGSDDERSGAETLRSLLDISNIRENELVPKYLLLLSELKGEQAVSELWPKIQAELEAGPNTVVTGAAIASIEAFLKLDNPERALTVAQQCSKHIDLNEHLSVKTWKALLEYDSQGLLRTLVDPKTTISMLQHDLRSLELVLGATWIKEGDGHHLHPYGIGHSLGTNKPDSAYESNSESSKFTSGVSLARQIQAATQVDGCSRSRMGLTMISDLLNEHEGIEIPLRIKTLDNSELLDYAWFPCCSPLEFAGNLPSTGRDMYQPLSTASLGLISVRVDGNGIPVRSLGDVRLMQLGYIGVRASRSCNDSDISEEPTERWRNTGHIVALDRQSGELVILWAGEGSGVINPGLVKPAPPPELPYIFGNVTLDASETLVLSQRDNIGALNHEQSYWVDVDSGSDIIS
ncbi:uncharacterized protein GIQ15_02949 [Arthroderma uncinatum]|uniref:uncharacterized protein n=1 Tax=Arthroderma uncinatum TaxID=74035 RepID=UPI00144A68D8|nr:uncharacterized protein GIQ15_02949 [Arthroderma uncinatum]KAF3483625.1 hypothetical protein GIQ15_02949 [Arthroderma uncinatum]